MKEIIEAIRADLGGVTLTELAKQAGVGQGYLSDICNGNRRLNLKTAKKLDAVAKEPRAVAAVVASA